MNQKYRNFKSKVLEQKSTIRNLIFSIFLAVIYYFINLKFDNYLFDFLNKNNLAQAFILFLTVISFLNIFTTTSLRKEINEKQVRDIAKDERYRYEQQKRNDKAATY